MLFDRLKKWWTKQFPKKPFGSVGEEIVFRSSTMIGGFDMHAATALTKDFTLADQDVTRILRRYREHVAFWNVGINSMRRELEAFALASKRDPLGVIKEFDAMPNRYDHLHMQRISEEHS